MLISSIRDQANKFLSEELTEQSLTKLAPSHGAILAFLFDRDIVTMKELAKQIGKDKSTVTVLVRKLEQAGYVSRDRDEVDSRVTNLTLTKEGRALWPKIKKISKRLIDKTYKDFTKEEKTQVVSLLNKIKENWNN